MKRLLIGFFLILFIFLSSGYSQLYAHSLKENESATPVKVLKSSHPGTGEAKFIVDAKEAVEEEDDDNNSSKKYLDSRSCLIAFDQIFSANAQCLPICKPHNSLQFSSRYVLFSVFRI